MFNLNKEDFWTRYLNKDKNNFQANNIPPQTELKAWQKLEKGIPTGMSNINPKETSAATLKALPELKGPASNPVGSTPNSADTVAGGLTGALNLASTIAKAMEEKPQSVQSKRVNWNPGKSQTLASDPMKELEKQQWLASLYT